MDENHQDKTGSHLIATEGKLWIPPLSPKEQEKLDRLRNNQTEDIIKKLRGRGYKVTEEYNDTGQLSKISREFPSKKTRWDWAQLLIVPLLIFFLGSGFTLVQYLASQQIAQDNRKQDLKVAQDNRKQDLSIAQSNQEEATLKAYLDDMTALLLDKKLGSQAVANKVASADAAVAARAKTLTALRRLTDAQRKARVLQFLYEAHLIDYFPSNSPSSSTPIESIINLDGADLSGANLSGADLSRANLSFAHLSGANLSGANLYLAYLRGANLSHADLIAANLIGADLVGADLSGANLYRAHLGDADLYGAHLEGAHLSGANLYRAHLEGAHLSGADLSGADLSGADLSDADLYGADLSDADLSRAILKGAQYNTKAIQVKDALGQPAIDQQGKPLMIEPTQWPQGFDPKAAGATETNTFP